MSIHDTAVATAPDALPEVRDGMTHQLRATWVVMRRELLRFRQDRARMVTMLLQPLLFVFVMGVGLGTIVDTGGDISFQTFLFPGVLATSVLFTELGVGIRAVTVTRPSLDDVFLTYTGRTIRDSEGPQTRMAPFAGRR